MRRRAILLFLPILAAFLFFTWMKSYFGPRGEIQRREEAGEAFAGEEPERAVYFYDEFDQELLSKYQTYNSDVVGLITIPGTVLNHPVMQTKEDEAFYLSRDLDKKPNSHGVPFLSKESSMEGQGGNRIIYGHNIHKISRDIFADLAGYEDLAFYREHPVIRTVSKNGTRRWLIFAYFLADNRDEDPFRYSDTTSFLSEKEFDSYIDEVDKRNWLEVPVELSIEDTYLTLSSCSNELSGSGTNRMVVMAKQLYADETCEEIVSGAAKREDPLLPRRLDKRKSKSKGGGST